MAKTITMSFEFPDTYDFYEIIDEVTRVSYPIYTQLSWKVLEKKND